MPSWKSGRGIWLSKLNPKTPKRPEKVVITGIEHGTQSIQYNTQHSTSLRLLAGSSSGSMYGYEDGVSGTVVEGEMKLYRHRSRDLLTTIQTSTVRTAVTSYSQGHCYCPGRAGSIDLQIEKHDIDFSLAWVRICTPEYTISRTQTHMHPHAYSAGSKAYTRTRTSGVYGLQRQSCISSKV